METQTLLMLTAALAAGAIVKGATGLGLPLIALPLLTAAVGLQKAIGILIIPLILTNAYQVWAYRDTLREPGLRFLPGFLAGGLVGIALGTWALGALPERLLEMGLGVMLFAYVALRLAKPDFSLDHGLARRLGPLVGLAAGTLQGATGIAAPIGVTFIHARRLVRRATVFAVSVMFLGFSATQYGALIVSGIYRADWIWLGLFACVPILLFMPLGEWLGRRAGPRLFDRLILAFLLVVGTTMLLGL